VKPTERHASCVARWQLLDGAADVLTYALDTGPHGELRNRTRDGGHDERHTPNARQPPSVRPIEPQAGDRDDHAGDEENREHTTDERTRKGPRRKNRECGRRDHRREQHTGA